MANECIFCGVRHIETNTIVLNEGAFWVEFCQPCGENHILHNAETSETLLVRELWDRCQATAAGREFVRNPADITTCERLAAAEAVADYRYDSRDASDAIDDYCEMIDAYLAEDHIERKQLARDHWENHEYRCLLSSKHRCPRYAVST